MIPLLLTEGLGKVLEVRLTDLEGKPRPLGNALLKVGLELRLGSPLSRQTVEGEAVADSFNSVSVALPPLPAGSGAWDAWLAKDGKARRLTGGSLKVISKVATLEDSPTEGIVPMILTLALSEDNLTVLSVRDDSNALAVEAAKSATQSQLACEELASETQNLREETATLKAEVMTLKTTTLTAKTQAVNASLSAETSAREAGLSADTAQSYSSAAYSSSTSAEASAERAESSALSAAASAQEATDTLASTAKTTTANIFTQPQTFNSTVSLNGGASSPTAKVTAVNLYDTTKISLSSAVVLPVQASDTPVDVLTFTAPSEGVYQILACLYADSATSDAVGGAGGNKLVSSLVRVNGANTLPLTNALITRFKDVASPFWESLLGTADKMTNFSIYSTRTTYAKDHPYFISFKVETQKLKSGDKLILQGHGWSSVPANTACMRALTGSFLHVTKLI